MIVTFPLLLMAFLGAMSLVLLLGLLLAGRDRRLDARLKDLSGHEVDLLDRDSTQVVSKVVRLTLPKMGKHLLPDDIQEQSRLKTRLIHAGLYSPQVMAVFLGFKLLLMILPVTLGLIAGSLGLVPTNLGVLYGGCASIFGMIGPSFWLDRRKVQRQMSLRRALPDAVDLVVICLDGGLSLPGALRRVTGELQTAHPILAAELRIVQQEIQLGHPTADALHGLAVRCDLAEMRGLTAAVRNAERFGASVVKSLRTFADSLRTKRQQRAEELAQKAGTKLLFPTLIFIFPAIFLIILGPAVIQILEMMEIMK